MTKWRAANYGAFLRKAREKYDLTPIQSRALYREMKNSMGRSAFAVDLDRHPRIRNRALKKMEAEFFSAKEEKIAMRELENYIDLDMDYYEYGVGLDY